MLVKIISIMLKDTYTTDDLSERLGLMQKYYNRYLFGGGEKTDIKKVLIDSCDTNTLKILENWTNRFDEESIQPIVVYEALDSIREDLTGLPSVTVYVPVRFPNKQVEKLGIWFRENVQPNILISLHIDPRATGGCSFVWNSVYYDFSLKYFLDKKKDDVVSIFNKHTHVK